jgi:hypothetical protein
MPSKEKTHGKGMSLMILCFFEKGFHVVQKNNTSLGSQNYFCGYRALLIRNVISSIFSIPRKILSWESKA